MDLTMPRMGGYAALHEMRMLDPTVRVLLVTGNVQDLEQVQDALGVPLLTKPYRAQELQALLSEIMMTEWRAG
jgi:CheY-like chemotaxis protein